MAFMTSQELRQKNIRHIYCGPVPRLPVGIRGLAVTAEAGGTSKQLYTQRMTEYLPDHNCFIPRAPAFNLYTKQEVSEVVERLQQGPNRAIKQDGGRALDTGCSQQGDHSRLQFVGRKSMSREELHELTERINKPTKTSIMREQRPHHLTAMQGNDDLQ